MPTPTRQNSSEMNNNSPLSPAQAQRVTALYQDDAIKGIDNLAKGAGGLWGAWLIVSGYFTEITTWHALISTVGMPLLGAAATTIFLPAVEAVVAATATYFIVRTAFTAAYKFFTKPSTSEEFDTVAPTTPQQRYMQKRGQPGTTIGRGASSGSQSRRTDTPYSPRSQGQTSQRRAPGNQSPRLQQTRTQKTQTPSRSPRTRNVPRQRQPAQRAGAPPRRYKGL